ncbi:hypothetical protein KY284_024230 [Solanum tuberosum]|nr:hypothetical protein KY284_024230 [Solanum tuberosum]
MGENNCWERQVVITELTKGKEFMLQLQKYIDPMKQDVCLQYLAAEPHRLHPGWNLLNFRLIIAQRVVIVPLYPGRGI